MQIEISLTEKILNIVAKAFKKAKEEDKTFYVVRGKTGKPIIVGEKTSLLYQDFSQKVAECTPKWITLYSRFGNGRISI
jgi:hypothetical protein